MQRAWGSWAHPGCPGGVWGSGSLLGLSVRGLELGLRGTPGTQSQQGAAAGARVPQARLSPTCPSGWAGRSQGGEGSDSCWDEPALPTLSPPRPSTPPLTGHACPGPPPGKLRTRRPVPVGPHREGAGSPRRMAHGGLTSRGHRSAGSWGVCQQGHPHKHPVPCWEAYCLPTPRRGLGLEADRDWGAACSLPASPDLEVWA